MTPRLKVWEVAPEMMQAFADFSVAQAKDGLEHSLQELVKIRASQLNGCAFCLHMHTLEARKAGESELRLLMLPAWRESPLFTARERAALAWTESLTRLSETHAPDEDYAELAFEFTPEEQVKLTMLIGIINAWNRFGAGFRAVHAGHPPVEAKEAA
ncbi:carboxymuconolactone decarboxylase family protein [Sphingomonas cannabina]|uniref:carboxymuconolactone decarboxylase family protein n=1 Tax=Sphingomonas cannabina TaxID=2899123 RepID=UPI001F3AF593|nr:carboxymuconolactone decarboxylase family protein [Sphingomonas cannabina]UIJ43568.1 carboxymuconolactone decarboxylase family protein [Sphingomonas cannabina]